ncbi:shikimate dehydrogenase [Conexibacter sp. DBS9H8]|uniref:shikimate dehydrogenase family protein n=1 Tax=Conexibacter sp. DBS9H8 TaxID=2937801 RepID=UPI00200DB2AC|nr:shikimate dehydrogenase [Conexibacter sp. DBS9H8]
MAEPGRAPARLGVLGWPVRHSRSPAMQNAALAAVGLTDWRYQLLPVPPARFRDVVGALAAVGFAGANVTIPHKPAALALADVATSRAAAIGAANTLQFGPDGRISADNTDGPGLIAALRARGWDPRGRTVQILGAGGTARAALWALAESGAIPLVWNRTPERAEALCAELGGHPVPEPEPAELLIQTTAAGLGGSDLLPNFKCLAPTADGLGRYRIVVDFMYSSADRYLLDRAARQGASVIDGLELLVRQGALSFEQFTGRPAPVGVMEAAARS